MCHPWCSGLGSEYYVYDAPDDIYCRHDNCTCTVTYVSERGAQDAHTKNWIDQQELDARRGRIEFDREYSQKQNDKKVDFYGGPNGKILEGKYAGWIGNNRMKQLLNNMDGDGAKKYIKDAYRPKSFIGDGGTVDIRKFEKATGRNCGRKGNSHSQKVDDLINEINNILNDKDFKMTEHDKNYLLHELRKLRKVQDK
jgi:hypothetical protein